MRCLRCQRKVLAGAGAGINASALYQRAPCFEVERTPLALFVRDEGTTNVRTFLPVDAEPMEVFQHSLSELGARALRVEVFVSEDEYAASIASTFEGDPERPSVTEVKQARGRGSDPATVC